MDAEFLRHSDGLEQYDLTIFSMEETDDEANIHMVEQFFLHDGSDYEDAHEDHSLVHLYEAAFEQLTECSKSNGIDMDNTHVCMDGNCNSLISELHVRMINGRAYSDEFEEDVQLILDSGADISVLPERYGSVGEAAAVPSSVRFRDAQGNNLFATFGCVLEVAVFGRRSSSHVLRALYLHRGNFCGVVGPFRNQMVGLVCNMKTAVYQFLLSATHW